ncbi:MAG: OmpA family protein [Phycisphaerae bacterium]|nr:OmpA family protein [Phycisphaerae bacterium]
MKKDAKRQEDDAIEVPAWVISYTDMITLLLSFFVMLQVFAHEQNEDLFLVGQGSFRRAISGLGIPDLLLGKQDTFPGGYKRTTWWVEPMKTVIPKNRVIDADDDQIRKIFGELHEMIEAKAIDIQEELISINATGVRFAKGQSVLDESAKQVLRDFADTVRQNLGERPIRLRILGLAADEDNEKAQWPLSAARARAVESFLTDALAEKIKTADWQIESLGTGPGGLWCKAYGVIPEKSFVAIAVIGVPEHGKGN